MAITMPMQAKVSTKGWIVIPAPLRKKVWPGTRLYCGDLRR
jgi:hypothetical protein